MVTVVCLCVPVRAAPVFGKKMKLRQPDGRLVEVRVWGDEYYQIVESLDGYTLARDPVSRSICYAKPSKPSDDKQELISSGIVLGQPVPESLGLRHHLRHPPAVVRKQVSAARAAYSPVAGGGALQVAGTGEPIPATTSTGIVEGICLLVDFSDDPGTIAPQTVSDFCNQVGYNGFDNNGSVRDYFHDVSMGNLTYTNFVPQQYHRALHTKAYYDDPEVAYGTRARELITEALNALESAGFDFSNFDADEDGKIDAINCFYAGTTTSGWAAGLWPHCGMISFTADGVSANRYQISDMGDELCLDTFCHENGHMLCNWPDLYDYGFDSEGIGKFCLMSNMASTTNPVQPCGYLKYIAGWTQTTLLVSHETGLSITSGQNQLYKFAHPTYTNEYYLLENRQKIGRDQALPDAGLAIWHIDTYGSNDYQQQLAQLHYQVTLLQADGRWDLERNRNAGDNTDLWKSPGYTMCGSQTNPNTNWWEGTVSGLGLSQISDSGPTMTFTFGSAAIVLNTYEIQHILYPGSSVPEDLFTIANLSTIVPMDYTIGCTAQWLTATPLAGSSQGEADTIVLSYDNASIQYWPSGHYGAVLSVFSDDAQNSPQSILVQLIIGSVGADLDADTDVDQTDYGLLQACMSGFGIRQTDPECTKADLDDDGDVDRDDVTVFMGCLSGSGTPADLDCE